MADIVTSQTRISNRALILLGSTTRIVSVDDPAPLAKQIKDLWHETRRAAIVTHPWNFALFRRELNKAGDAPAFGYSGQFKLPEDCLRWLPPARGDCDFFEGEEEGGYLLSNCSSPVPCRYIRDVPDVTVWPAHFAEYFAYHLAHDLAETATQIGGNVDDMAAKMAEAFTEAKRMDGLASGSRSRGRVEYQSRWANARMGGYQPRAPGRW